MERNKKTCKHCGKKRKLKNNECTTCHRERTKTYWKDKCWEEIKKIIKLRDGDVCVTCGKRCEGANAHCGHFMTGATCSPSLYYELTNIHRECYHCNVNLSGNWVVYLPFMISKYGQDHVDMLLKMRKRYMGEYWTYQDYRERYEWLKEECELLQLSK